VSTHITNTNVKGSEELCSYPPRPINIPNCTMGGQQLMWIG